MRSGVEERGMGRVGEEKEGSKIKQKEPLLENSQQKPNFPHHISREKPIIE